MERFESLVVQPLMTALILGMIFGKHLISFITGRFGGQPIRADGPLSHMSKANTPNMGGFIIFFPLYVLWPFWGNALSSWCLLVTMLSYNVLGFVDDYLKSHRKNSKGVTPRIKLAVQFSGAIFFVTYIHIFNSNIDLQSIFVPFFGYVDFGMLGLCIAVSAIVATANAVNLTDGLDGLASLPIVTNALFIITALLIKPQDPGLVVMMSALVGGVLAFLWYNAYPAKIFMGDNGSMGSGCLIGCASVLLGLEFMLAITGLIFVVEATSVLLQISYFKITGGKRIFLMAPFHHHLEKLGIPETRIVARFWIISIACLFAAVGILTSQDGRFLVS